MSGTDAVIASLVDTASDPNRAAGRLVWHFARGVP